MLEGSVRRSGNHARITAQLIKVDDGFHLWSETYDRELDNIFEVQDEIAKAIVDALKLPLLGHDAKPLTSTATTDNFEAYDLYLLGRHHARVYSEEDFNRAIEYYLRAIEIDPSFAAAYSGLADGYIFLSDFGNMPQGEAYQLARSAAEKALAIDPDSPEAHTSMGLLLNSLRHSGEAETHFLNALEVNPNYVNALLWYCNNLNNQYRVSEGMGLVMRAMNVDPLSHNVRRNYALQMSRVRRFDDAQNEIQAFIAAKPDDPMPYELWGDLFMAKGLPQNAVPMFRNAHRLRPGDIYMAAQNVDAGLALDDEGLVAYWLQEARGRGIDGQWTRKAENMVMYAIGDYSGLLRQVDQLLEALPGQMQFLSYRSVALMNLGQTDAALETLQSALESSGYESGQGLNGSQLLIATQLANALDLNGDNARRDALLAEITTVLGQLRQAEPAQQYVLFQNACLASVKNDLSGVLHEMATAVDNGFRKHWELLRNPIFKRWQENPEFIAFYKGMIDSAAAMRSEYQINNPAELTVAATKGVH